METAGHILEALGFGANWGAAVTLVFLRVGAAAFVLPGIGESNLPARLRLGLALMITLAILPAVAPRLSGVSVADGFLPETAIGLFLGLSLRFFVFALATVGTIIANATSLSQLFPDAVEPQPAIANLLVLGGLAMAVQADLLVRIVAFLLLSYDAMPAAIWPDVAEVARWGSEHADRAFSLGFQIALPFVMAALLYNLALGVINRAMPQLMVTFVGAPALSLGGLVLLAVTAPLLLSVWLGEFLPFLGSTAPGP